MKIFNAKDFGTIQAAVTECVESGGGTVIVSKGKWESGTIHLKSHVNLYLEDGAVVSFSNNFADYLPPVFTRWEGTECYNYSPLIYAKDCENISITGNGTLVGNGQAWWGWKQLQRNAAEDLCYAQSKGIAVDRRIYGTSEAALRPSFIQTINCKNILLEGFTIVDGPQWTIHPVYCENVTVRNINISTHGPNTDGLNPDSCKNVLVEGCTFDTGDDCIAINSGMNEDGWRVNRACENVEIRNCVMNGGHGALVIGSAVSGGVKNVYFHDCKITGTMQGIRLKSMRGRGGFVDGVRFENIEINNVSDQAIQINLFYEFSTVVPKSTIPSNFRNIEIRNIRGMGAKIGIQIKGLPEQRLKNIILENIELAAESAFDFSDMENIRMNNVIVKNMKNEGVRK
ncbi:MAG: glycoside hydrolase family 28 protein [Clostridia bacterium]|nr:glycoside hydrolase family 28 protein [Clostridia bacterium]